MRKDRDFKKLLQNRWDNVGCLCVGLDPVLGRIPQSVKEMAEQVNAIKKYFTDVSEMSDLAAAIVIFNIGIIKATAKYACAFKPQSAFYEVHGPDGLMALKLTVDHIQQEYPEVPIILDAKRGDIGSTNAAYAGAIFDYYGFDAVTLAPYLGIETFKKNFLSRSEKGCIFLCRTSNPDAPEFQDLQVNGRPLYRQVARNVSSKWNGNGNCCLVVGATYPEELAEVRKIVGDDIPFLMPGIGTQGGDVEAAVTNGKNSRGDGMIINSSSGISFAYEKGAWWPEQYAKAAAEEAKKLNDEINKYR